jgi:signal transduction histidine kinase
MVDYSSDAALDEWLSLLERRTAASQDGFVAGWAGKRWSKPGMLGLSIVLVSLLHYLTSTRLIFLHEIFQRAYYLPIILAAVWYGLRGGILGAAFSGICYLPHVVIAWHAYHAYSINQYIEIVMFFVVGTLSGVLADQEKRQRKKLQETAEQLSRVYRELQNSFEQLRRADRLSSLGQLSAGLAHEIRNPLGAIRGAVEILQKDNLPAERRKEFSEIVLRETRRLNDLVQHILDFARPRKAELKRAAIVEVIHSVLPLIRDKASKASVRILSELPSGLPEVELDLAMMQQVLLNLMVNAIEAMPQGGDVRVRAFEHDDRLRVEIVDQGSGIEDSDLEKIFDPFYTTKENGTGLGLSIAHQLIEQQGGRMSVFKNRGAGMTFSITFPAVRVGGQR